MNGINRKVAKKVEGEGRDVNGQCVFRPLQTCAACLYILASLRNCDICLNSFWSLRTVSLGSNTLTSFRTSFICTFISLQTCVMRLNISVFYWTSSTRLYSFMTIRTGINEISQFYVVFDSFGPEKSGHDGKSWSQLG